MSGAFTTFLRHERNRGSRRDRQAHCGESIVTVRVSTTAFSSVPAPLEPQNPIEKPKPLP
jgi:hypothetical protein